jgi:hypothetical protein
MALPFLSENVDCVWNVMEHAQKTDFVFRRNGRVHLNRQGRQFSRLLAAEVCASASVMLDTPRSEVVWEYWLPTPFASFPFASPPMRHRVPSCFNWNLLTSRCLPLCFETHAGLALENGEENDFKRELKYDLIIMLMWTTVIVIGHFMCHV